MDAFLQWSVSHEEINQWQTYLVLIGLVLDIIGFSVLARDVLKTNKAFQKQGASFSRWNTKIRRIFNDLQRLIQALTDLEIKTKHIGGTKISPSLQSKMKEVLSRNIQTNSNHILSEHLSNKKWDEMSGKLDQISVEAQNVFPQLRLGIALIIAGFIFQIFGQIPH